MNDDFFSLTTEEKNNLLLVIKQLVHIQHQIKIKLFDVYKYQNIQYFNSNYFYDEINISQLFYENIDLYYEVKNISVSITKYEILPPVFIPFFKEKKEIGNKELLLKSLNLISLVNLIKYTCKNKMFKEISWIFEELEKLPNVICTLNLQYLQMSKNIDFFNKTYGFNNMYVQSMNEYITNEQIDKIWDILSRTISSH
jgi:hypothetical protein